MEFSTSFANRKVSRPAALLLSLLAVTQAQASIMTFEGLQDFEYVQDYYAGGHGSLGSGPGPNYGISFTGNAYTSIDADAGGTGNFGGEPSPSTAISFQQGSAYMNSESGFASVLSFYYSNPNNSSSITLYSGKNGTGQVLGTLFLPLTAYQGQPDPTGNLSPLVYASISFSGVAHSVDFIQLAHSAYVDDISITPVPEPETGMMAMIGLGVLLIGKRFRRSSLPNPAGGSQCNQ